MYSKKVKKNLGGVSEKLLQWLNENGLFMGNATDFMNLPDDERDRLSQLYSENLRKEYVLQIRSAVSRLDNYVNKLDKLCKKLLSNEDEASYFDEFAKSKEAFSDVGRLFSDDLKLLSYLESKNITVPDEVRSRLKIDFKFPKLGMFDGKYKGWSQLIDSGYVIKLKNRQIFSAFDFADNYGDKNNWKKFFEAKKAEYDQFVEAGIYSKTFEEYLTESTLVTFELLGRLRFPQRNALVKKAESPGTSQPSASKAWASYEEAMSEVWEGHASKQVEDILDFVSDVLSEPDGKPNCSFKPDSPRDGIPSDGRGNSGLKR